MVEDTALPVVSVICLAYNHSRYIRKCLDGFVMQQTDFRYEVIIHDDASDDGTDLIIKEYADRYPDIFVPVYQTVNQYSQGVPIGKAFLYPRAKGKYIAECEGDDYWTDPLKLQKQVDFLESHPDYVLCSTNCNMLIEKTGEIVPWILGTEDEISMEYLMENNRVATLTVLYRADVLDDYLNDFSVDMPKFLMGDYPMWIYFRSRGKIRKLPDVTAMYLNREGSESHKTDRFEYVKFMMSSFDLRVYCNKKLNLRIKNIRLRELNTVRKECRKVREWPLFLYCIYDCIYNEVVRV